MCCGHCAVAYLTAIDRDRWHNNILRFINQTRKHFIASLLREDLYILARTLVSGLRIIRSEMDLNAIDYASDSSDDDCSLEAPCQGFTNGVHSEPVLGFERYGMGLITYILCLAERVLTFLHSALFSAFFWLFLVFFWLLPSRRSNRSGRKRCLPDADNGLARSPERLLS
jgi:lysylphosphatidylglycerol synthetase-like protein (DUF2156 family)